MTVKKIKKDIYWVGAIDWDRRLFDELSLFLMVPVIILI